MSKINNLNDCIDGLENLIKNVDLTSIDLDDPSMINNYAGYNEEDRVKEIIEFLKLSIN